MTCTSLTWPQPDQIPKGPVVSTPGLCRFWMFVCCVCFRIMVIRRHSGLGVILIAVLERGCPVVWEAAKMRVAIRGTRC